MIKTRLLCLAVLCIVIIWLTGTSYFSMQAHHVIKAANEKLSEENMPMEQKGDSSAPNMNAQGRIDSSLQEAVAHFITAADQGDLATIVSIYDPEFMCVRVADEGGFVQLTREQMIGFWKNAIGNLS